MPHAGVCIFYEKSPLWILLILNFREMILPASESTRGRADPSLRCLVLRPPPPAVRVYIPLSGFIPGVFLCIYESCLESIEPCDTKNRGTDGWSFCGQPSYFLELAPAPLHLRQGSRLSCIATHLYCWGLWENMSGLTTVTNLRERISKYTEMIFSRIRWNVNRATYTSGSLLSSLIPRYSLHPLLAFFCHPVHTGLQPRRLSSQPKAQ